MIVNGFVKVNAKEKSIVSKHRVQINLASLQSGDSLPSATITCQVVHEMPTISAQASLDSVLQLPCCMNKLVDNSVKNVSFPSANEMNGLYSNNSKSKS